MNPLLGRAAGIAFWFDFGSPYSHLSAMRIEDAAARRGIAVAWRPFLLGPVFEALGWTGSPLRVQRAKGEHAWIDLVRRSRRHGVAWTRPSVFPRRALLPSRLAVRHADAPWIGDFCRRVMALNFVHDRDIDTADAMAEALDALGLPAGPLLDDARSDAAKDALRRRTDEATAHGIFGAPTFFVGGEMYWGDDRLDDALDACAADGASSPPHRHRVP